MMNILDGERIKFKQQWANEIIPGKMWLGSGTHASNIEELRTRHITRILNVADDVENFHESEGIVYENLNVTDFGQDKGIMRVFPQAFRFLQTASDENQPTLVHCAAGANRSATVVIAWLMYSQSLTLFDAWKFVKSIKKGVCPMNDNRRQLLMYERELYHGVSSFVSDENFITMR